MKRQPWFWPIKRFIKRISGKELWLKTEVEREVLETGGWIYIPDPSCWGLIQLFIRSVSATRSTSTWT